MEEIKGINVPIKTWAPLAEIESSALVQLKKTSSLPWVFHHIAAMPDVHGGIGATVGSVIAMKDAISPSCVGVDIGCVDSSTEYLSPSGWRKISEYDGGDVLQYQPETDEASFIRPINYIKLPCEEFLHFKTKYGIDQMLSEEHRMLCWKITGRDRRRVMSVIAAADMASEHDRLVLGAKAEFKGDFKLITDWQSIGLSEQQLRVQVMVMADAHLAKGRIAVLGLKKDRKITRARQLLSAAGIEFSENGPDENGVTIFRFPPPLPTKTYESFWGCVTPLELAIIADECLKWDGNEKDHVFFTRDKGSADFISFCFAACGKRSVMRVDYKDGVADYRVFAHANTMVGLAGVPKTPVSRIKSEDGLKYCFTLPSGFWVMRRGGCIAVTGNCGMSAIQTSLVASDLPDNLDPLRSEIEAAIPVGFNGHQEVSDEAKNWSGWTTFDRLIPKAQDTWSRARMQMGTLGGGNHFIEICLDTSQRVWLMLHSGSRNVGKTLAEIHIEKAKKLAHNEKIIDKDLAVFLAGTPEMAAYRHDLTWAQDYAMRNRQVMMHLLTEVLRKRFPEITFGTSVNCHHNFVAEEVHFGTEVFVTRKGAISAEKGRLAVIPGSMGAKSFIVEGLGNPDSYNSASHGAGRKMSRGAAKRTFTLDDLAAQTAGVCCRKDAGVLDEIPEAYKDIDRVMENQRDLVKIVAEIKQVMCIKG